MTEKCYNLCRVWLREALQSIKEIKIEMDARKPNEKDILFNIESAIADLESMHREFLKERKENEPVEIPKLEAKPISKSGSQLILEQSKATAEAEGYRKAGSTTDQTMRGEIQRDYYATATKEMEMVWVKSGDSWEYWTKVSE